MKKLLDQYLTFCKSSGLSATTVDNYKRFVNRYLNYCEVQDIHPQFPASVAAWKGYVHENGVKQSTLRAYLEAVNLFFSWCVEMELVKKNPCIASLIKTRVPVPQTYEKVLTQEEIATLLTPNRPKGISKDIMPRTYAIVVLFLTTGLRNTELRELCLSDLDFENGVITVRFGKGNKSRVCPFPNIAREAVKNYLSSPIRPKDVPQEAPLFGVGRTAKEWKPFTRSGLSDLIARYIKAAIGRDNIRTHALRHTNASALWDAGMSADEISGLLGHSNVAVTARYLDRLRPQIPADHAAQIFDTFQTQIAM